MFDAVLVANRGEIAVRVIRTLRALGIRAVAVYSDADSGAPHVGAADVAVRIGPAPAAQSYLSIERVLDAALATGAQAIHPGYGFLAENAAFAAACEQAGIVFVGPPAAAIEAMGDKIRAKQAVAKAGVPVVPGSDDAGLSDEDLAAAAREIGFPVLLKPSAGGGGKGMREVRRAEDLAGAVASARREARGSFGDDTLLVERLVTTPRHIEIQVLADAHGNVVHLGERECSLQRRHQKIVEEAPSALLTPAQRAAMGAAAVDAARAVGYVGAGTVEFIVSGPEVGGSLAGGAPRLEFFFMEMNTRLQVEHPVTELVTGLDLVELQLRVAAGEPLPFAQDAVELRGHAIEARVYAEDPAAGFLPTGGRILALREPSGPGIRVDSGVAAGGVVGSEYDPMLAKVIAHGADRAEALRRLDAALADTVLLGLGTNIGFLRAMLADPDVRAGRLDTGLVGRRLTDWTAAGPDASGAETTSAGLPDDVLAAAAAHALLTLEPAGPVVDPFDSPGGWRVGEPAWTLWRMLVAGHDPVDVRIRGRADRAEVVVGDAEPVGVAVLRPAVPLPAVPPPAAPPPAVPLAAVPLAAVPLPAVPPLAAPPPEPQWGGFTPVRLQQSHPTAGPAGPVGPGPVGRGPAGPGPAGAGSAGAGPAGAGPAAGVGTTARPAGAGTATTSSAAAGATALTVAVGGVARTYHCVQDGPTLWISRDGHAWAVREQEPLEAARHAEQAAGGPVLAPMPGTVTVVEVEVGRRVAAGDRLVVVEAMKMEHVLTAPVDGVVRELRARVGATVAREEVLALVEPDGATEQTAADPAAEE